MINLHPRAHDAINDGLLYFADPSNGIAGQLLHGDSKCLVIHTYNPYPAKQFQLLRPGDPGYDVPNFLWDMLRRGKLNIRAGVPLWIQGMHEQQRATLGCGVYHPLTTSATVHMLKRGLWADTVYFSDPRLSEVSAEEMVDEDNQRNGRLQGLITIERMHGFEYRTFADIKPKDIPDKLFHEFKSDAWKPRRKRNV